MGKILEQLGIFGISEATENSIFASMTLGDPAILIGPPGTAKTDCVQMIASAMREFSKHQNPTDESKWLKFAIYDASKLEYEDLLGIPNPKAMGEGKMEFIETPTTIWGKVLVCYDEFNRTNPDRQSNLLEHIRSRTIQGIPTGTKFILAAMNPYGDTGTEELSDALVDRFLFYLKFPEFADLDEVVKELIIEKVGQSDCVALKHYWSGADKSLDVSDAFDVKGRVKINEKLVEAGKSINSILQRSMTLFGVLQSEMGTKITQLIRRVFDSLNGDLSSSSDEERVSLLSGRRAGLVRRGLLAHRAVELAKSEVYDTNIRSMLDMLKEVFPTCMPFGVSGKSDSNTVARCVSQLYDDICSFWPVINDNAVDSMTDIVYELLKSKSLHRQLYILLKYGEKLGKQVHTEAWTRLAVNQNSDFDEVLQIIATNFPGKIPENVQINAPDMTDINSKLGKEDLKTVLKGSHTECIQEIERMIAKWESYPVIYYFVVKSIHRLFARKDIVKERGSDIRAYLDDISLSANEIQDTISELSEDKDNESSDKAVGEPISV